MALFNTRERFGSLTKLLHWTIFILFVVQYSLVYRREYLPENAPEKLQYILLHKSFGVIILGLAVLMILWGRFGKRPPYPKNAPAYQKQLAKSVHVLLYISMLLMPMSGILMSFYGGRAVSVFGYPLPMPGFITLNKPLAEIFYQTHVYTSYVILGLVSLHIFAALYHHFIVKDNILKRMWPGK